VDLNSPEFNISLSNLKKPSNFPEPFKEHFSKSNEEHADFIHIYPDDSKDGCKIGAADFENHLTSRDYLIMDMYLLLKQKLLI
jgi:hypothetical protein